MQTQLYYVDTEIAHAVFSERTILVPSWNYSISACHMQVITSHLLQEHARV